MRFVNKYARVTVLFVAAMLLTLMLTACPGGTTVSLGVLDVNVDATYIVRCDDGVKVVVEGIQEDWGLSEPVYGNADNDLRTKGPNWVWVEPGHAGGIGWDVPVNAPASKNPEGKQITVKAYCMRKDAEPGLSQRSFELADYLVTRGPSRLVEMRLEVRDSGADPSYTVTPPGLTIEPHE